MSDTSDAVSRRSAPALLGGATAVALAADRGPPSRAHAVAAPREPAAGPRVERLVARLTLDEKISLLHGATDPKSLGQAGYVPGVERLGIPPLRLADGPAGVRVKRHATTLPAPVLPASAFYPALARLYGQVIGREGRALGQDVLLSPMVNLIRTPYEDLRVDRTGDGTGGGLDVEFTVRNTGRRDGIDIPQVYVGSSPDLRLGQAVRVLGGYQRLMLQAGESRRVTVRVDERTLSSWDPGRHGWVPGTGRRTVWVGGLVARAAAQRDGGCVRRMGAQWPHSHPVGCPASAHG